MSLPLPSQELRIELITTIQETRVVRVMVSPWRPAFGCCRDELALVQSEADGVT
jgi:hypothetical protein